LYPNGGSPKVSAATSSNLFLVLSETELAGLGMDWLNVTELPCCFLFVFFLAIGILPLRKYYIFVGGPFFTSEETSPSSRVSVKLKKKSGQDTNEIKRWRNLLFQALSSLFFTMEPTEDSNEAVGYESDDVPLISLMTPNMSNKKRK
jgi:hypothetical protein